MYFYLLTLGEAMSMYVAYNCGFSDTE